MDLISVIVPVYNVESYLPACIESILTQSYQELEILLIDDGSTDHSREICDEYGRKDNRIRVFHKSNGGLSDARNYGLNRMSGSYVSFVDSDDYLSTYALEILYREACAHSADIVFTQKAVKFNDGNQAALAQSANAVYHVDCYGQDEILEYMFYQRTNVTGVPGKLYAARLFENDIRFPYGVYYEDLATTYRLVLKAFNIVMVNAPLYAYRTRSDGIIHQSFSPKKLTCIDVTQKMFKEICEKKPNLKSAAASRCCSCNRMVYSQIPYHEKQARNRVWQEILQYRRMVLLDNKARKRERISCLVSYLGQGIFYTFSVWSCWLKYQVLKK